MAEEDDGDHHEDRVREWLKEIELKRETVQLYVKDEALEEILFETFFGSVDQESSPSEVAAFVAKLYNAHCWSRYRGRARFINYNARHSPYRDHWFRPEYYEWLVKEAEAKDLWPEQHVMQKRSDTEILSLQDIRDSVHESALYQCNCGSRRVKHTQQQIRSADEPMTSIFHCVECNKRWKK